jgi:hypothetical protein
MYFSQVLEWLDDIGSSIAADFLVRWPRLEKMLDSFPTTAPEPKRSPAKWSAGGGAVADLTNYIRSSLSYYK